MLAQGKDDDAAGRKISPPDVHAFRVGGSLVAAAIAAAVAAAATAAEAVAAAAADEEQQDDDPAAISSAKAKTIVTHKGSSSFYLGSPQHMKRAPKWLQKLAAAERKKEFAGRFAALRPDWKNSDRISSRNLPIV